MRRYFVALGVLLLATPSVAQSHPLAPQSAPLAMGTPGAVFGGITAPAFPPANDIAVRRVVLTRQMFIELSTLRREGLELQQHDGGTLSPEHRAYLQTKLEALDAKWRRMFAQ